MTFDRRRALQIVFVSTFGPIFPTFATAAAGPEPVIRSLNADLGDVASRARHLSLAEQLDAINGLLNRYFDLMRVASGTIGSRRFRRLESDQRNRFVDHFTRYMVASYVRRLPRFEAERTEVGEARDGPPGFSTVRVQYHDADGGDPTVIDFVAIERDATWRIVDVRMGGAFSEMALRRSEVTSVMESQGFEGLIALLDQRTEELLAR